MILNELSNDKLTLQNKKILKLAYGFTENDFKFSFRKSSHQISQLTEESNQELLDNQKNNISDSEAQSIDRSQCELNKENVDISKRTNILHKPKTSL